MTEPVAVAAAPVATPEASADPIEAAIVSSIADIRPAEPETESNDDGTPPVTPAAAAVVAPVDGAAPAAAKVEPTSEIDALIDAEMGAGHGKKKENRIPYSRTVKIAENAVAKAKTQWQTEQAATVKAHTDKIAAYEADSSAVEQMILGDTDRFIQTLVQINPAYQRYFKDQPGAAGATSATTKPEPDVTLPDGRKQYSDEGIAKLLEWQSKQTEDRLAKRFEPMETAHRQQKLIESAMPRVQAQMTEAAAWPLFNEHKGDVLKALQANPQLDLRAAYQMAVFPKLVADRTKMREEILAEMAARPHTTATAPTTARTPVAADGPKDLEDIIRASIRKT